MMKLNLTTEIAIKLDEKVVTRNGIEYNINTSTYKRNDETVLEEMVVDAFKDGDWVHELSCVYHENDNLDSEHDEWLLGLID